MRQTGCQNPITKQIIIFLPTFPILSISFALSFFKFYYFSISFIPALINSFLTH